MTVISVLSVSHLGSEVSMKKFWKSKVFWLNLLALIAEALGINPLSGDASVLALSVANLGLRFLTSKELVARGPETRFD